MQDTIKIFKALADQTRLDIVRKLAKAPKDTASCGSVSTCSSLSQPAMSHHFKKLVDAEILLETKYGTEKIYSINHELFEKIGINPNKL